MKFIKYSFLLAFAAVSLTSCLKDRADQGGLYEDEGSVVTSIAERNYLTTDAQNIQFHYANTVANLNFSNRPNEMVKFFTVTVNQPRKTKITGNLVLKVETSDYQGVDQDGAPYPAFQITRPPAGAINVTDIVIPAQDVPQISVPVMFSVNKSLLSPGVDYGLRFRIMSPSQGAISALDSTIDVLLNYSDAIFTAPLAPGSQAFYNVSDYNGSYNYSNSVVDPLGIIGINNRKDNMLIEVGANQLEPFDPFLYAAGLIQQFIEVRNFTTGGLVATFKPRYILNSSGQVTSIQNGNAAATVSNIQLDPSGENRWVYTNNITRTLKVKFTFTYTTVVNGVNSPRTVRVEESYSYDKDQIYF